MRIIVFLLLASISQAFANDAYSQKTRLSIDFSETQLVYVLDEIEDQSEFFFLFNEKLIDTDREVSMSFENQDINKILDELFSGTDVDYNIIDRKIILAPEFLSGNQQQQQSISGTVTDEQGVTLPGVSVKVKGATQGTITNADGEYSISDVPSGATLQFSFIGMLTQEVLIGSQITINVIMAVDAVGIDEVVVIGYGVMKKSDLSGAVGSIKGSEIEKYATGSVGSAIQGKIAGVEVITASGKPGRRAEIIIRGPSTLGSNIPLYIIDGMPDDINNISPNDIESIEVLKDGSAAAIYGSRAANGVVLITTKQGVRGAAKIQVKAYYGMEAKGKTIPVANAEQHVAIVQQAYTNDGFEQFYEGTPASYGEGSNYGEALFSPAPIQNYNILYSGGNENFVGSASLDYFNQGGIVLNTGYERISSRIKTKYNKGKFEFNQILGVFHGVDDQENTQYLPVWRALEMPPTVPIYDENNIGGFGGVYGPMFDIMNPIAAQTLMTAKATNDHLFANFSASFEVIPKLYLKLNTGATVDNTHGFRHTPVFQMPILSNMTPKLREDRMNKTMWLAEGTFNYDFSIEESNFSVLLGVSTQKTAFRNLYGYGANMPNDDIQVLSAATEEINAGGIAWAYTLASQFGRINYNFDDRYIFSATIRRDGSSRFGDDYKYGLFPSVSGAWRISEESFFPDSNFFRYIKIRASYGELGNQEIDNYAFSASINSSIHYVLGSSQDLALGATQVNFATPDIRWESTISRNIGIDMAISNSWVVNIDYFSNKSVDLLVRVPIPSSNGSGINPYQNIGEIRNKGLELTTSWNKNIKEVKLGVLGTFSYVKNKVISLGADNLSIWAGKPYHLGDNTTLTKAGGEIASFYLIKTDGIFNSQEEISNYTYTSEAGEVSLIQPDAVPGDIRFIDANNDGVINADDRTYAGSAMPKFIFGLNLSVEYKNFDLTCFFQGVYGNKIYNGTIYSIEGAALGNWSNMSTKLLDAWTPDNHSNIPRLTKSDINGNGRSQSDRFLQDGSYFKMKTLQIGYNLPIKSISAKQARIYFSAQNLFTITSYEGYDPDIANDGLLNRGVDNGIYPPAKTYLIGVQLTF